MSTSFKKFLAAVLAFFASSYAAAFVVYLLESKGRGSIAPTLHIIYICILLISYVPFYRLFKKVLNDKKNK